MHRLILGLPFGDRRHGDHIDGNGLNNRRSNLRIVTRRQNAMNRRGDDGSSSQYKGVYLYKNGSWQSYIYAKGKRHHLGYFAEEVDAALAHDEAALQLHGPYAKFNFPRP